MQQRKSGPATKQNGGMALVGTYYGQALPLYGYLLVVDPSVPGHDEPDLRQALSAANESIIAGSGRRVAIKAGQDTAAIGVTIELWETPPGAAPGDAWQGPRTLTVDFPHGTLILENISSGPVRLQPGDIDLLALPGGPGAYHVTAWHRGREQAAAAVRSLWDADDAGDDIASPYGDLAGLEEYLLQIWPRRAGLAG